MSFSKDVFCYIVTTKWTNTVFLHLRKISGWVLEIWINGNVLFSPSDCMLSANTARLVQCFLFIDHHLLVRVLDLINMKSGDPIMYLRQRTCPCKWVTLALQGNVRTSPLISLRQMWKWLWFSSLNNLFILCLPSWGSPSHTPLVSETLDFSLA